MTFSQTARQAIQGAHRATGAPKWLIWMFVVPPGVLAMAAAVVFVAIGFLVNPWGMCRFLNRNSAKLQQAKLDRLAGRKD